MIRIKICGITRIDDALQACACGADALGLVFYEKSPRCVTREQARAIVAALPPFVTTVGLFVNERPEIVREIVDFCGLDVIQLHGDEGPDACLFPPHRVLKALRVKGEESLAGIGDYAVSALLLDAWHPDSYGGTGKLGDWELAARLAVERSVILAGGLNPENVGEAIRRVRPYGVDVSSGVESAPGCKDPARVAAFIRNARAAL
ncbi:phosphoribosylanthranilate isomerase [Trichloromonas sp.]|uniref:phosphoribosylanthranilate isomerase n=1 Tax=Trichloromonas sp. TaxID=3069249 RepID=UPI002A4800E4|nr:phosphoribosylanthranilate isomerase [Trichloromonas sp.]